MICVDNVDDFIVRTCHLECDHDCDYDYADDHDHDYDYDHDYEYDHDYDDDELLFQGNQNKYSPHNDEPLFHGEIEINTVITTMSLYFTEKCK